MKRTVQTTVLALFAVILLMSATAMQAGEVKKTVEIKEAGTLSTLLGEDKSTITDLTLTGVMNAEDFKVVKSLSGAETKGKIKNLNLAGVELLDVAGKKTTVLYPSALSNCLILESVVLPDNLTEIGLKSLYRTVKLKSITLPKTLKVLGEEALSENNELESITLPEGLTTIGRAAFSYCKKLKAVKLPETIETVEPFAFTGCMVLSSINLPESLKTIGESALSSTAIKEITLPTGIKAVSKTLFFNCRSLTTVKLHDAITSIEDGAFSLCSSMTALSIPSKVNSIGRKAFYKMTSLKSIKLYSSEVPTTDASAFEGLTALSTLYVPKGSLSKYKAHEVWGKIKTIEEFSPAVSNETIEQSTTKIYAQEGCIVITTERPTKVAIYRFSGELVKTLNVASDASINVEKGLYIVKTEQQTKKVQVP